MTSQLLAELEWRGLRHQDTHGADAALSAGPLMGYVGFDPTGPSLHLGHLVQVMGLVHLQRCGHRPVALVGGGTGMIGDPSGKSAERNLLTLDQVADHADRIRDQLSRFLDFSGPSGALLRNNADWLLSIRLVDFLRDVGKHLGINYMLAKDSVKSRLDTGISFTEFSYMLLQAYDFMQLYERDGVTLQMGGSDQWGNITAGTELVRRALGVEVHGVTLPLVTTADGKKFGKTAEGTSVWLDAERTSPYKFFQYLFNCDDETVGSYLRLLTLLSREEIEALDATRTAHPEQRSSQLQLATEVTTRVHGTAAATAAQDASRIVFDKRLDPRGIAVDVFQMLADEVPYTRVVVSTDATVSILDALVNTGLAKSKGDARRQLQQGAVSVNGRKLGAEELDVGAGEAVHDRFFLIRKGSRDVALVELDK